MIDKSIDWYLDWYLVFNQLIGIQSTKGEESGRCPERKKEGAKCYNVSSHVVQIDRKVHK